MPARDDQAPIPFPLESTGPAGVLDRAFAVIRARPTVVLGAVGMVVVPATLLGGLAMGTPAGSEAVGIDLLDSETEVSLAGVSAALALDSVANFAAGLVVARLVVGWFAGVNRNVRQAFASLPWLGALVATAAVGATQVVGLLVCIVGVLFPMAFFMVTAPAMATERLGPFAAMGRSWKLANRQAAQMIGLLLAVLLVATMVSVALTAIPWLLLDPLPEMVLPVARFALTAAAGTVVTAFSAAVATVAYLQLRIRTEGLDLELAATDAFPSPQ